MSTITTLNDGISGNSFRTQTNTNFANLNTDKAELSGATFTGDITVPDEAYGTGWNGSMEVPTKNAIYDKIETMGGGGSSTFLGLTDTPSSYSGQAGKFTKVNAGETALEFVTITGGGDMLSTNNLSDVANVATARTNLGLNTTANQTDSTDKRFMTDAQEAKLDAITGTNTGDQTSIVGITGTVAQFNTAITDGDMATLAGTETLTNKDISSATNTYRSASDTVTGAVELATIAETNTGTDATRAVTPDGLAGSEFGKRTVSVLLSGSASSDSALATGDGLAAVPVDTTLNGMNLVAIKAYVSTVSSSGAPLFQVRRSRRSSATARTTVDMLSTGVSIDANEFESADATTPAVINTSNDDVQTGDILLFDCDTAGTGTKGAQLLLTFQLP